MNTDPRPPDDHLSQLRQFLGWLLPTALSMAALLLLVVLFYPSWDLTVACVAVACYCLLLIGARVWLSRGNTSATVAAICSGLLLVPLAIASTSPSAAPVLVLLPSMAITAALPYVGSRSLRRLSLAVWLITLIVTFLSQVDRFGTISAVIPSGLELIGGVGMASALILLLLWQFSSRLSATLAETRAANSALQAANTKLERQHAQLLNEQEALRQSEELFRLTFEIAPIGMALTTIGGRFLRVNRALCAMTEYTADELLGRTFADIIHPSDLAEHQALSQQLLSGELPFFQAERRYIGKDGRAIDALLHVALIRDSRGNPLHLLEQVVDMTERNQAEQQRLALERRLLETQKLESIGLLAGGIAHDFNNLLVGILGNAGLITTELPPDSFAHARAAQIETAALRAAELTQQMLAYAGKGRFVIEPIDLNTLIAEIAQLLGASVTKNAGLHYQLAPDLPPIEGDATQIRQVVMNLIVNASEAIGDQPGIIQISTGARRVGEHAAASFVEGRQKAQFAGIHDADLPAGDYVVLEVADTGCGMDEATVARIFDPFFTTKFTGRGLGLAAVQGIIRSHGGALDVASSPGRGTTFRILLPAKETREPRHATRDEGPATSDLLSPVSKSPSLPVSSSGEEETVLVIDDEPDVRIVAEQMLMYAGFTVLLANNGPAGIELFREHVDTLACVLLDLTMPIMDGEEVFRALHAIRPETPIILMSGYSEQEVGERFDGAGLAGFLQKPFTLKAIEARVRQVLVDVKRDA